MTNDEWVNFVSLGASACLKLKQFEEAIIWCDKGLAVSFLRSIYTLPHCTTIIFFTFDISLSTSFIAFSKLEVESMKVI